MRTLFLLATLALTSMVQPAGAQDLVQICAGARGPQQAIPACNSLIQTSPMDFYYRASLFHNRGLARALLDDVDGAIADFTRALQDYPNFADAYNNRGFAYAKKGQLEAARSDLEHALAINPNHPKARETLNKVVQVLKDRGGYPGRSPDGGLIDEWETRSLGTGHRYRFHPDGTYEYTIFREIQFRGTIPVEMKTGTYMVQGDRLTLNERGGGSTTYRWSIGGDPLIPGSRVRILSLSGPQGEQRFYGSSR